MQLLLLDSTSFLTTAISERARGSKRKAVGSRWAREFGGRDGGASGGRRLRHKHTSSDFCKRRINNRNPVIHKSALSWIEVLDIGTLTGLSSVSVQRRLHSGSGCRLSPAPAASTVYATPSYPSSWTGPRSRERLCAVRRVGERTDGSAASENEPCN